MWVRVGRWLWVCGMLNATVESHITVLEIDKWLVVGVFVTRHVVNTMARYDVVVAGDHIDRDISVCVCVQCCVFHGSDAPAGYAPSVCVICSNGRGGPGIGAFLAPNIEC